jgi:cold shock CspA family protein
MSGIRRGVIPEFDDERGLGLVEESAPAGAGDGELPVRYRFHVTAIAGATRTIAVGTKVVFLVAPQQLGEYEATDITPVPADLPAVPADA